MSSTNFRLESFRPWNPFQDKAHPPRDSLDIHRYPSPISIATTLPPSNPRDPASKSPKVHSNKSERHPLPARPPVEVCLDGGLHSVVQTTRHEPEDLARIAPVSTHTEIFDPEDILQVQTLPGSEDLDSATITGNMCLGAEGRSSSFGPCDLEPAVIAGQHPQAADSRNLVRSEDLPGIESIDPTILNDHAFPGGVQIQATETISGIAKCPGRCPSECSQFPNQPSLQYSQLHPKRMESPSRQFSKPNKRSSAATRQSKNGAGRSNKGPGRRKNASFPTVLAQFSALSVEDRLQFLSWLFESALSHCVATWAYKDVASVSECISGQDVDTTYDCDQSSLNTQLVEAHQPPSRKGLPWSMEENCLLVNLREEQNLAWSEVTRRFAQKFPGRSKGSLQVYWSTTLKKQRLSLVDVV